MHELQPGNKEEHPGSKELGIVETPTENGLEVVALESPIGTRIPRTRRKYVQPNKYELGDEIGCGQ